MSVPLKYPHMLLSNKNHAKHCFKNELTLSNHYQTDFLYLCQNEKNYMQNCAQIVSDQLYDPILKVTDL